MKKQKTKSFLTNKLLMVAIIVSIIFAYGAYQLYNYKYTARNSGPAFRVLTGKQTTEDVSEIERKLGHKIFYFKYMPEDYELNGVYNQNEGLFGKDYSVAIYYKGNTDQRMLNVHQSKGGLDDLFIEAQKDDEYTKAQRETVTINGRDYHIYSYQPYLELKKQAEKCDNSHQGNFIKRFFTECWISLNVNPDIRKYIIGFEVDGISISLADDGNLGEDRDALLRISQTAYTK